MSWTAKPTVKVKMARFTPRTRTAGMAKRSPGMHTARAERSGAIGNGIPQFSVNRLRRNAETPANMYWAREICPTKPVRTISEKASSMPTRLVAKATR